MATKFEDFVREVEEEAHAEGPQAVAELAAFRAHFAMAQEVRELRKARHLTQKQLAEASGINQAEISRIERGQGNPTTAKLAAVLAPLGGRLGVVSADDRDFAGAQ
ncbi:MAG: helix-turn-helix domain-containing protein [Thermoleophilaceae bacterium]